MIRGRHICDCNDIISLENLLEAWREFVRGKKDKHDVQLFQLHLFDNIEALHRELILRKYCHGDYEHFKINDPKPRDIHKASVRDRLLHHAIYRKLYPFFDQKFIADSFSCRLNKGTHRALGRFKSFAYKISKNNTRTIWILKCDIKKFFASIDHGILMNILCKNIADDDTLDLLRKIISSFHSTKKGKGLPLGNLTSQLLVNIYMNEFDQFVKHVLKTRYYIRYADDFVIMSRDKAWLERLIPKLRGFLSENLKLTIHPDKIYLKTLASGVDFLGWVHFPDHRILRTATKRRMFRNIKGKANNPETIQSYLGLLKHGNTHRLQTAIIKEPA